MSLALWLDGDRGPAREPLEGHADCEVCVVGGGISGVCQALMLAERGVDVVLVERDRVAGHASGRNAGFLITGLGEHYVNTARSLGREGARTIWESNRRSGRILRDLVDRHGIDCDLEETGSWVLAFDDEEWAELKESHALLVEDGFPSEVVEPDETEDVLGAAFPGALHSPWDGQVNPVKLVEGLAGAAEDEGARLFERTPAVGIHRPTSGGTGGGDAGSGGGMQVETREGAVDCAVCVLATNAYTPLLWAEASEWLLPARGQALATAPVDPPGDNPLPGPVYADHGWVYFRPYEGRFLVGGFRKYAFEDEIGYDEVATDAVQGHIDDFRRETWPDHAGLEVTHRWAGTMAMAADGLPIMGPLSGRPELVVNVGHTGHGLAYAPQGAMWIADMLETGDNAIPGIFSARRTLSIKEKAAGG